MLFSLALATSSSSIISRIITITESTKTTEVSTMVTPVTTTINNEWEGKSFNDKYFFTFKNKH